MPDRRYFEKIVRDTGFGFDVLEKTYHLIRILQFIFSQSNLKNCLTLKGGTSINFAHLDMPRLSVDIDLNLTGVIADSEVEQVVEDIFYHIKNGGSELGYQVEDAASSAIWRRKILKYQTLRGPMDFVKVELDKIERVPLMSRVPKKTINPFPELGNISVYTYNLQELVAMKVKSLFDRGHPRDLYDLYKLSETIPEPARLIDLVMIYSCFTLKGFDLRELIEKANLITQDSFAQEVVPFLRSGKNVNLQIIKTSAIDFLKRIYAGQGDSHKQFLSDFRASRLRLDLLPATLRNKAQMHPSIQFWMQAR